MLEQTDYGSFSNREVIVTTYGDPRLVCLDDAACWAGQAADGPTFIVIRPAANDDQLAKVVERYRLNMDDLKAFRTHHAR